MLSKYLEALSGLGHPVEKHLCPGASISELEGLEQEFQLKLPQEIKELLLTFNGVDFKDGVSLGHAQLIEGFHLMSVDEIGSAKEIIDEIVEDFPLLAGEEHVFDGLNMLPFMADDLGNHMVVDVTPDSKSYGTIGVFEHADESETETYTSFLKMIEAHLAALKAGIYSLGEDGYIEADIEKLYKFIGK